MNFTLSSMYIYRYIYTDDLELNLELVMFILYAAKKYLLLGLTTKCTDFLSKHLNASNACAIYDQSLLFQEVDLTERCMNLIQRRTRAAFAAETATNISQNTLSKILVSERFSLWETDVFKFTMKWVEAKCNKQDKEVTGGNMRGVLGQCLYKIRFPTFESREFAQIVGPSGILTKDEELGMLRHLADKESIPAPDEWLCMPRFLPNGPHKILTTEEPKLVALHVNARERVEYNMTIVSNLTIKVKSLVVGTCYVDYYELVKLPLSSVTHKDTAATVELRNDIENYKEEWKVSTDLIIKAGQSTLKMKYLLMRKGFHGSRYVINKRELSLKNEHFDIRVMSDSDYIPLLGLKYEFV